MSTLQQLFGAAAPYGLGAAILVAVIYLWRWARRNVSVEYGPEVLGPNKVRMRLSVFVDLPSRHIRSTTSSDGPPRLPAE